MKAASSVLVTEMSSRLVTAQLATTVHAMLPLLHQQMAPLATRVQLGIIAPQELLILYRVSQVHSQIRPLTRHACFVLLDTTVFREPTRRTAQLAIIAQRALDMCGSHAQRAPSAHTLVWPMRLSVHSVLGDSTVTVPTLQLYQDLAMRDIIVHQVPTPRLHL